MTSQVPLGGADIELQSLSQQELDEWPRKYVGYPKFASYVSSDDDFAAFRRFDRLHTRILLGLQDNLSELEEELDLLDYRLAKRGVEMVDNGSIRNDQAERIDLVGRIERSLREYDGLLYHYIHLKARPNAPKIAIRNMRTWLRNHNHPINPKEVEFLRSNDLIALARSLKSPLRGRFEQWVLAPTNGLFGLLAQTHEPAASPLDRISTVRGQDHHVDVVAAAAIFVAALVMLVAPLWVLAVLERLFHKLSVITAFSIVFLAVMTWGTVGKPFEILAASAGYTAVLVVFLQLGQKS